MRNSPRFCASKCGKTDVRRPRKRKEKALKPSGFKAFPVAGAEGLEVASQPLLRCPKKSSGCRFSSIFSTAAPTPARCIRHRRRSQAPPLAVPETADARFHSRRFDRCANPCSLYPPPAALAGSPACGARNGRCSLSLAPFRPLRQPLLAVSATGGARRRCPACGFGAAVGKRKITGIPPYQGACRKPKSFLMLY